MIRFADCEVNLGRFELRREQERVHVEPQVFAVLAYLLRNRDRVVTKSELLDAVWGDRYVSESALTSRIKALRRTVGDDGRRQQVIATVHGVGYRFVAPVEETAASNRVAAGARPPQQIRYCVSPDGVRVAYATAGSGEPLVKAAHWFTRLDLEWESPIWGHYLDALTQRHRLVRYDERGCGLSDWQVPDLGFDTLVNDLELVVDAASLERFPLIGMSQGGAVAIAYAVRNPERVSRLILAGAYLRGRFARATTAEEKEEAALYLQLARTGWQRADSSLRQVFASQLMPDAPQEIWEAFDELQRATTSTDNVVRFLDVFAHIDITDIVDRVRCPALVVHSRGDVRVPQEQAKEIAARIPDSQLVLLDSHNHVLTADEPAWPVFVDEMDRFLAGA